MPGMNFQDTECFYESEDAFPTPNGAWKHQALHSQITLHLEGRVSAVVSVDTIVVTMSNEEFKVKIIGLDAFSNDKHSNGASNNHLKLLCLNNDVVVKFRDQNENGSIEGIVLVGKVENWRKNDSRRFRLCR